MPNIHDLIEKIVSENYGNLNDEKVKTKIRSIFKEKYGDDYVGDVIDYLFMEKDNPNARYIFEEIFFEDIERSSFTPSIPHCAMVLGGLEDLIEVYRMSGFDEEITYEEVVHNLYDDSEIFLYDKLEEIYINAKFDTHLLIIGETGTSKELLARVIHSIGNRRKNNFVEINCAAIPENLLESELFGFLKGAFSGAGESRQGLLQAGDKGIVFLDEICKMPRRLQAKLLKVIEEQEFLRLGATTPIQIDIRFLAAAQPKDIENLLPDLKYRLGYPDCILMPTLRERLDRAPYVVINHSLETVLRKMKITKDISINKEAITILSNNRYEGNFRELENVLRRAVKSAMTAGRKKISSEDLKLIISKEESFGDEKIREFVTKKPDFTDVQNVKLKDIIDYADNIKSFIVEKKVKETKDRGKDIKTALKEEGLSEKKYQGYLKKIRSITKKGIRD